MARTSARRERHYGMDLDGLLQSLGDLVRRTGSDRFDEGLREFLRPLFAPQNMLVLLFEQRRRPRTVSQWIPDGELRSIFERYYFDVGYLLDPFYELAMSDFTEGSYHLREIAPDRFFSSAYYRRYYRQTRMIDELGALAALDTRRVVHLSIGRLEDGTRYSKRERALFKSVCHALMPVIVQHCRHEVGRGDLPPGQEARRDLKERLLNARPRSGSGISRREAEIAFLVVQGHSTTAIGLLLDISPQTVKVHRRNIYRKLNISSQAELFAHFASQAMLAGDSA